MSSALITQNKMLKNELMLRPQDESDQKHRVQIYVNWMNQNSAKWYSPDIVTYREYLLHDYQGRDSKPLSPNSVRAHLSTIRGRYATILKDNQTRDIFFNALNPEMTFTEKKLFIDEVFERIKNAIDPDITGVKVITHQDVTDSSHLRLNKEQVSTLLTKVDWKRDLISLRDYCAISLMLCTGIREAELCNLDVTDLYQTLNNTPALYVRHGKGAKARLIPYGELIWVRDYVAKWLGFAGIESGAIMRGFYKGGKKIRSTRLTVRAINQILDKYPIQIDNELRVVKPHDLRRTYARQLYEAGMDILAIRDNLGHADSKTTLKYIGVMDVDKPTPISIYNNPEDL